MAEVKKIGNHTYRKLTDEEARAKYGSSFVFVGPAKPTTEARELLKRYVKRLNQRTGQKSPTG